jgi:hypothetical protein
MIRIEFARSFVRLVQPYALEKQHVMNGYDDKSTHEHVRR